MSKLPEFALPSKTKW